MWVERIALTIAVIGIAVLTASWFLFNDSWTNLQHPSYTQDAWFHIKGDVISVTPLPQTTLIQIQVSAPVTLLAPPTTNISKGTPIEAIAKQTTYNGNRYLQALKMIY